MSARDDKRRRRRRQRAQRKSVAHLQLAGAAAVQDPDGKAYMAHVETVPPGEAKATARRLRGAVGDRVREAIVVLAREDELSEELAEQVRELSVNG